MSGQRDARGRRSRRRTCTAHGLRRRRLQPPRASRASSSLEVVIESGSTASPPPASAERSRPDPRAASLEGDAVATWTAGWQPEDAPLQAARQRAAEVGVGAVDAPTGAALRMLAAAAGARHVIELGTGAGVSTLWLLRGMRPDGVLTTVDADAEHQRMAKATLAEAAVPNGRVRLIAGRALEVLPRLSDAAYDLVFCDAQRAENLDYLEASLRLLRPGGLVVFAGALAGGKVADPSARDADTVALRELARSVRDQTRLVAASLPVGQGLLVAALS